MCDVLCLFKSIQLDPNFKNNYKELARHMTDAGWNRDNNQCCQQVNIELSWTLVYISPSPMYLRPYVYWYFSLNRLIDSRKDTML